MSLKTTQIHVQPAYRMFALTTAKHSYMPKVMLVSGLKALFWYLEFKTNRHL